MKTRGREGIGEAASRLFFPRFCFVRSLPPFSGTLQGCCQPSQHTGGRDGDSPLESRPFALFLFFTASDSGVRGAAGKRRLPRDDWVCPLICPIRAC
ncbi:hypothetical protein VTN96DRAFT_6351 [Rasamsonia emersonii]